MFSGLFDLQDRIGKIEKQGDPLVALGAAVDWDIFRADLEAVRQRERKSNAGRPPYDVVLMFKILVLQSLYNLSDDAAEYQILDRLSFMRFLGLGIDSRVPDAKTIWLFREQLREHGLEEALFARFHQYLLEHGFLARKGQIVDASIVEAPRQRNSREENERVRAGEKVEGWSEPKRRQKDTEATWTKKGDETHFGYKNHISVDREHKLIRAFTVTTASVHDSQMLWAVLDTDNTSADVWADSAYRSEATEEALRKRGFRSRIHRKGARSRPLSAREKAGNKTRSRVRARVKIGLRNLCYNIVTYARLAAC
jgi:IS5 family transposase